MNIKDIDLLKVLNNISFISKDFIDMLKNNEIDYLETNGSNWIFYNENEEKEYLMDRYNFKELLKTININIENNIRWIEVQHTF